MNRFDSALSIESLALQIKGAAFKSAIRKIPREFIKQELKDLELMASPTDLDRLIKQSFWDEYQRSKGIDKKMELKNVYEDNCSYTHWYSNILGNPLKLAWILSPLNELMSSLAPLKFQILNGARKILDLPISDENGVLDYKIIEAKINIFKCLLEIDESCRYKPGEH